MSGHHPNILIQKFINASKPWIGLVLLRCLADDLSDFTGNTAALLGEIHWKKDVLEAGIVITPLTSHFPRKRSMKHFRGSTGELDELARARHIACLQQRFPRLD